MRTMNDYDTSRHNSNEGFWCPDLHSLNFSLRADYRLPASRVAEGPQPVMLRDWPLELPLRLFTPRINRASCRSREELLTGEPSRKSGNTRPVFTTIYHPLTGQIGDILRKHWGILQSKPDLHQVFREPPMMAFRRGKNLRDLLVSSKFQQ